MRLTLSLDHKILVSVKTLSEIYLDSYQVNGGAGSIRLNVKAEMLHELDVVHINFLAQVALERHVSLELAGQNLNNYFSQFWESKKGHRQSLKNKFED